MAVKISTEIPKVSGDVNAALFAERARIGAILESPEGIARPKLARELALHTSMPADQARAILASTPPDNPFAAAMDREGVVGIPGAANSGAAFGMEAQKEARKTEIARSMQHFNEARGYKTRSK